MAAFFYEAQLHDLWQGQKQDRTTDRESRPQLQKQQNEGKSEEMSLTKVSVHCSTIEGNIFQARRNGKREKKPDQHPFFCYHPD